MSRRVDMNHDIAFNQATSSSSIVAVMSSLEPKNKDLRTRSQTSYQARPRVPSRSLSHLPRYTQSETSSSGAGEEMVALLRPDSLSTTFSPGKSSTSSSHSPVGSSTEPSSTASSPPREASATTCSPEAGRNETASVPLASSSTMSPHARRKLLRSARKVGYLLGETPVLSCANNDSTEIGRDGSDSADFGMLSPVSPGSKLGGMNTLSTMTRLRPNAEMGLVMYDGLVGAIVSPHRHTSLSVDHTQLPTPNRTHPVLKVDCSLVAGPSKHSRQGNTPEAEAQSFVSTTTTTTAAGDLFSSTTTRGSPTSTIDMRLICGERPKEKLREARRSTVAKLSRHLGEHVPPEVVFPADFKREASTQSVLVSYEGESPASPLVDKSSTQETKMIEPPTRSTSLRRRKRKSLHVELDVPDSPEPIQTKPPVEVTSPNRLMRKLSRSNSARARARKNQPASGVARSSMEEETENVRIVPTSAPPHRVAHERLVSSIEQDDGVPKEKEKQQEPRMPLSDVQKQLNVRRAQKMLSVFGEPPPNSLLAVTSKCESPSVLGRSVLGGSRYKRHSISSIMTAASSFMMDLREPATFDSPISPMTPRPKVLDGESSATPTRTPKNVAKLSAPLTPRRRASLSALPNTPPPYFDPQTPPSPMSPIVGSGEQEEERETAVTANENVPTISHSPQSSSGSSNCPYTPGSEFVRQGEDPGAVFRERRLRAAKLARFFGVGYGDLYPALNMSGLAGEDDKGPLSASKNSFDSIPSARMESIDKEIVKVRERERRLEAARTRVSVTVQREVDRGMEKGISKPLLLSSSASTSSSSLSSATEEDEDEATSESRLRGPGPPPPPLSTAGTKTSRKDWEPSAVGCYGGLSFSTGLTASLNASTRRRQVLGVPASPPVSPSLNSSIPTETSTSAGTSSGAKHSGLGLSYVFSLGRQSRRPAVPTSATNSVLNSHNSQSSPPPSAMAAMLGRKGSIQKWAGGARALTPRERRSLLTHSSCGELNYDTNPNTNSNPNANANASRCHSHSNSICTIRSLNSLESGSGTGIGLDVMMSPRIIRVGEKITDVNEVMAKLRELR